MPQDVVQCHACQKYLGVPPGHIRAACPTCGAVNLHSRATPEMFGAARVAGYTAEDEEAEEEGGAHGRTYSADTFAMLVKPIFFTVLFACLAVVHIRTPETTKNLSNGMSSYTAFKEDGGSGDAIGLLILKYTINAILIIVFVAGLTFGIVLLFLLRLTNIIYFFLYFSVISALSWLFGFMFYTSAQKWGSEWVQWTPSFVPDWITLVFVLYNFGIAGVLSIFGCAGCRCNTWPTWCRCCACCSTPHVAARPWMPTIVTQSYLVLVSVAITWQLSYFPTWTAWLLLVALAVYDLCAVLLPCGPLKLLIDLAQKRTAAGEDGTIPALLYEAHSAPRRRKPRRSRAHVEMVESIAGAADASGESDEEEGGGGGDGANAAAFPAGGPPLEHGVPGGVAQQETRNPIRPSATPALAALSAAQLGALGTDASDADLSCISPSAAASEGGGGGSGAPRFAPNAAAVPARASATEAAAGGGGDSAPERAALQSLNRDPSKPAGESMKLGLGDFIFYSLLVSKAALAGFTPFAACVSVRRAPALAFLFPPPPSPSCSPLPSLAPPNLSPLLIRLCRCFLVVVLGLVITLIILAILEIPLPALPFSMFAGVLVYFWADYLVSPFVAETGFNGVVI